MNLKKELLAYLISGGITTGVNYFVYAALLFLHLLLMCDKEVIEV